MGPGLGQADLTEKLERVKGIEPSYSAWEAAALPLSYTRVGLETSNRPSLLSRGSLVALENGWVASGPAPGSSSRHRIS